MVSLAVPATAPAAATAKGRMLGVTLDAVTGAPFAGASLNAASSAAPGEG
ncbi:hypothetical protein J7E97_09755 [Streptomyces sp. ISL-66]|nr:hypothetical protein [Streptomyces sp. ISL-66]MBT2468156.1 hypothetical protein [Streptomyces sp. ISL-66]